MSDSVPIGWFSGNGLRVEVRWRDGSFESDAGPVSPSTISAWHASDNWEWASDQTREWFERLPVQPRVSSEAHTALERRRRVLCAAVVFLAFAPGIIYTIPAMLAGIGEGQPPDFLQRTYSTLLVLWLVLPLVAGGIVTVFGLTTRPWWRAPLLGMAPVAALCLLFPPLLGFLVIPAGMMLLGQWLPARVLRGERLFEPMVGKRADSA